jgi:transmembrane sensor
LENSINDIDDLIGKYLAGETSPQENMLLEKWTAENEGNRKYFEQFKVIFDRASMVKEIPQFNTDAAWNKVRSRLMEKPAGKVVELRSFWGNVYLKIAASIIILVTVGLFLYRSFGTDGVAAMEVVAKTKIETDTLPDGSAVTLNKQSRLAYTFDKKEKTHKVKLKGEAYFKIQHKKDKDFIVETENVLIKDIGTSFNVKAYPETNSVEVVVEEGEVHFYTATDDGIFVRAGGKGIYNKTTKKFSLDQPEANVASYKTKHFVFSDTDLATMALALNNVYDRKIKYAPHLANCRLTVTFTDETPEEIANVIAETLGLSVTSEGLDLLLEGKACEN